MKPLLVCVFFAVLVLVPVSAQQDCELHSRLIESRPARIIVSAGVNVRARPDATGDLLGRFPESSLVDIYAGPACAGGFNWWLVGDDFLIGWVVEGMDNTYWLEPYSDVRTAGLEGVALTYDEFVVGRVLFTPVEAGQQNSAFAFPVHMEVTFPNYPINDRQAIAGAQIHVYPVADYLIASPQIKAEIAKFDTILAERSPIAHYFAEESLPEIPPESVTHTYPSQLKYIDFQGGSGFRYITQLTQNLTPIGSDLTYIFQGMTSDGAYYVSAMFPVILPLLEHYQSPDGAAAGLEIMERTLSRLEDADELDSYHVFQAGAAYVLDGFTPEMFTPDLRDLDRMMESLIVETPS